MERNSWYENAIAPKQPKDADIYIIPKRDGEQSIIFCVFALNVRRIQVNVVPLDAEKRRD